MSGPVAITDLIAIVCPRAPGWTAAEQCCAALRAVTFAAVESRSVDRSSLLRIYERRLSRVPRAVLGADRLLDDLRSCGDVPLSLVALEWDRRVFGIICNDPPSSLVTCFVGDDRRLPDITM